MVFFLIFFYQKAKVQDIETQTNNALIFTNHK